MTHDAQPRAATSWRERLARADRSLLVLLMVALAVRLWEIGWALPEMYEEAYPLAIAWKFWRIGEPGLSLNPDFFHYPALSFYVQFALLAVHYAAGHLAGWYAELAAFRAAYETDATLFLLPARAVSVAFDLGTVALVHLTARRSFGAKAAFFAAGVAALSPLLVAQAHTVNVDSPMTFFAALACWFLTRLVEEPERRAYMGCAAAIGLAAASKYNGALLVAPLLAAHFWPRTDGRRTNLGDLALALGTAGAVFLLLNPYVALRFDQFLADFSYERQHMAGGHLGLDAAESTPAFYLLRALPGGLGWAALLSAVAAIGIGAARRDRTIVVTSLFPVVFLAVIGSWEMRAERYLLPVVPFLAVLAGAAASWAVEALGRPPGIPVWLRHGATILVTLLLFAGPAASTIEANRALGLPDTRTAAKEWVSTHLADGSVLVTGPFGIRFPKERFTTLLIPFTPTGGEALAPFYDPRWYEDLDLLVASDYDHSRFAREPERYAAILAQYERLRTRWRLGATFAPASGSGGPTVWLYLPPGARTDSFETELFASLGAIAETSLVLRFQENLASALFEKGRTVKSAQLMASVLSLDASRTRLVNTFAWTLFRAGRYAEALPMAEISLRAAPNQADMVGLRGSVRLRAGDERGAEADLLAAVALGPGSDVPYLDLELLYRRRNDRAGQLGILRRYLATLPPGSENARRTQAYLLQLEGR